MSKIIALKAGAYAHLNPLHSGFAHGFGIFETIRLSNSRLEFWQAHYERFLHSSAVFNLQFDQTDEALLNVIRELIWAEGICDGIVKLSLLKEGAGSCCYVYTRPIQSSGATVELYLNTQARLNEQSALAGHKTHNYMEETYLKRFAESKGFFDAVRMTTAGFLAETTVANLFFIKDSRLCTPALSNGILPGVIRSEVLQTAKKHSIDVEEGHYTVDFLKTVDAVFITNSSMGIVSVSSIDLEDLRLDLEVSHDMIDTLKASFSDSKARKSVTLINEQIP